MEKPILFSFFSGSGFLDLGFERNGFDIRFVNDSHKPFLDAYRYSRSRMGLHGPIYGYSNDTIEDLVSGSSAKSFAKHVKDAKNSDSLFGFIGGPPCPDFSVGGKNRGKDGENGKLTKVYVEAIIKYKPYFFIFENVKGLWRTKIHRNFYETMKSDLKSKGYILTDRLTNCIEYGTPQDRDRIFLFGIRKQIVGMEESELESYFNWKKELKYDRDQVLNKIKWPGYERYGEDLKRKIPKHLKNHDDLTTEYWFNKNDVYNHPNSTHYFTPRAGLAKFKVIDEGDDSKKSFKRLHRWRYSPTAAYGNNEVHLHPYKSRRLSAAEAMAIQSIPKNFVLPEDMTLSNMFKTIGNGVPYLASVGLAKTVNRFIKKYATQQ